MARDVEPDNDRGRTTARVVGLLVVLAAVISFVVQNRNPVEIHFWFFTVRMHLVWLVVVCLVLGALAEALIRRSIRQRRKDRR